jgi:hypothetical protein
MKKDCSPASLQPVVTTSKQSVFFSTFYTAAFVQSRAAGEGFWK